MRRRRHRVGGRKLFKKKVTCRKNKPKHTTCYKVKGGWKRRRV